MENPFTIMFGKEPVQLVSRVSQVNEIIDTFVAEKPSYQICMLTGVRGAGKTVALTGIASELSKKDDWIVIDLNPERDLLQGLAAKLTSFSEFSEWFRQARINLSLFGFGVEISGEPPITDIEVAIERMLEQLQRRGKRILITIDEVESNESIRVFAAAYQIMIRKDLPLFLLMTGLHENIDVLQNEKSLTFLYRAPKVKLGPLDMGAVAAKYEQVLGVGLDEAREMAHLTKGYPFAFQVLGYLCYRSKKRYDEILTDFDQYLGEYVYDKIWSSLSDRDKEISHAIALCSDGSIKKIRMKLGIENNQFNPYRKRLINKGIISGEEYGRVRFVLPRFEKYVLDNYSG